jgi:hypothetical protein
MNQDADEMIRDIDAYLAPLRYFARDKGLDLGTVVAAHHNILLNRHQTTQEEELAYIRGRFDDLVELVTTIDNSIRHVAENN